MSRRLSRCLFALAFTYCPVAAGLAAEQEFPYEATVVAEQVEVRCGPGARFYVTGYVNQNETVTVHRHDHGGWFMIAPPRGSLSWIDASLVNRLSGNRGVVSIEPVDGRPARAIVRIGSQISDDHSYYGRDLCNGDEVTILGEDTLNTQRGPVRMYKIVPPPQEFRWLKGEFVVPVSRQLQQRQAVDPYQVPPEHRASYVRRERTETETRPASVSRGQGLTAPAVNSSTSEGDGDRGGIFERLDRIDQQYAAMMQLPPAKWNLETVEEGYQQLRSTNDAKIRTLVDQRLEVLERRREILNHYQNFVRLTTETSQRDAQLQAMQSGYEITVPEAPAGGGSIPLRLRRRGSIANCSRRRREMRRPPSSIRPPGRSCRG